MYGKCLRKGYRCHCADLGLNKGGQREDEAEDFYSHFYQVQAGNTLQKAFMVLPPPGPSPMKTLAFHGEISLSPFHFLVPRDHIPSRLQPATSSVLLFCLPGVFLTNLTWAPSSLVTPPDLSRFPLHHRPLPHLAGVAASLHLPLHAGAPGLSFLSCCSIAGLQNMVTLLNITVKSSKA